jgi:cation diffusion facilitator CzcD-associated flavoprotein CzcO
MPGLQKLSRWRIYWFNEFMGQGFMGSRFIQNVFRRLALAHLAAQVKDPALRHSLTPTFNPGCKRILISNTWFPALQQPNVSLHTQGVAKLVPEGVVGADGTLHACDVIVWATGFAANEFVAPMKVYGDVVAGEQPLELSAMWREQPAATHLGITTAGFPNLYMLVGPNTGLGHNSLVFMIECQVDYIVKAMQHLRDARRDVLRLRPEVQNRDYTVVQKKMKRTVWASGCKSWYQNARGDIDTLWPGYAWQYWLKTRRFQVSDYL